MSSQPNQSLADGLLCLQALAASGESVGTRELARELGLHHVKTNRMLMGLAEAGFAQRNEQGRYTAGPALHVLAALATFRSGLLSAALPHLRELQRSTKALVALGVRWRHEVCYLFHGSGSKPVEDALGRTALHPATRSSIGLALLARSDANEVQSCYPGEIPGFSSLAALTRELRAIRKQNYAVCEHAPKGSPHLSIGVVLPAPIQAAIAVSGAATDCDITAITEQLHAAAAAIAEGKP